ncbi:hypothetical protein HMPREF9598_00501 [Cutibacterium acnes HL050PA1]|nr:hypothetical protein HMPREF9598_00501 [Cutibacterium acnes HL050PA1]
MGITSVIMLFMAVVVCFRYYRIVLIFSLLMVRTVSARCAGGCGSTDTILSVDV